MPFVPGQSQRWMPQASRFAPATAAVNLEWVQLDADDPTPQIRSMHLVEDNCALRRQRTVEVQTCRPLDVSRLYMNEAKEMRRPHDTDCKWDAQ